MIRPVRPPTCLLGVRSQQATQTTSTQTPQSVPLLPSAPRCVEAPSEGNVHTLFNTSTCFQGDWLGSLPFAGSFIFLHFPTCPRRHSILGTDLMTGRELPQPGHMLTAERTPRPMASLGAADTSTREAGEGIGQRHRPGPRFISCLRPLLPVYPGVLDINKTRVPIPPELEGRALRIS